MLARAVAGVGGATTAAVTFSEAVAVMPPAVAITATGPGSMAGIRIVAVNEPSPIVFGAGEGSTASPPRVSAVTVMYPAKPVPVMMRLEPTAAVGADRLSDAPDTLCCALAVRATALAVSVAVIVLVDGIGAVSGTVIGAVKLPLPSQVVVVKMVPR